MLIKIYIGNLLRKKFVYSIFVYSIIVALSLSVVALTVAASTVKAEKKDPSIDKIAIINGSVITIEEFNRELNPVKQKILQQKQKISSTQLEDIEKKILENLIDLELLFQESQNNGIKVEKEKIDSQMKSLKQKLPNNTEFKKLLTELKLSESALKLKIKKGIAIQELIESRITQKIKISDKESKVFYDTNPDFFKQSEQVKASHILIKVSPEADEITKSEAKQKLRQIQQKLNKNEDFATLAKEFSEGPSKINGGDLGYFQRGQMVKAFEDAAFSLKPEEVSDIVKTQFGYHLIKVVDKKLKKTIPYEDVKNNLVQHLKQEKTKQKVKLYIQTLREKAKIEKFL